MSHPSLLTMASSDHLLTVPPVAEGSFTVLMVEDNPGDRRLLETMLDEAGIALDRIFHAPDLKSGIALATEGDFGVILLDLNLPDSEGLETLIRMRGAVAGTPVVVLTGAFEARLAIAAVQEGAQDFLTKGRIDGWMLCRILGYAIERHRLMAALEMARAGASHRSTHDPLTGLPNRTLFDDRLAHAAARAGRRKSCMAVVFLDLDHFKPVNDQFGHAAGDAVLIEVGRRLSATVRGSDTVARLGGDEFVVLIEDAPDQLTITRMAEQLRAGISPVIRFPGGSCRVSASMGLAFYPDEELSVESLMRRADARMYADKALRQAARS